MIGNAQTRGESNRAAWQARKKARAANPENWKLVAGEGPIPAKVMLIGERPGVDEALEGQPFVGQAGKELDTYLFWNAIRREDVYVTNVVKTYRGGAKPTAEEIAEWGPLLEAEINNVRPEVIACLGTFAVEWVLGVDRAEMEKTHGVPVEWCDGFNNAIVVPMYHPAAGFHNTELQPKIHDDFRQLKRVMTGELRPHPPSTPTKWEEWNGEKLAEDVIAVDTEGWAKDPICLTATGEEGRSWYVDAQRAAEFGIDRYRLIILHNSLHDLGVLRQMGAPVGEGRFVDTMVLAYLLCVEPQSLKQLAYRHLGLEMSEYAEIVAEADKRIALEYLSGAAACDWGEAEEYVVWDPKAREPRVKHPWPMNKRIENILKDVRNDKRGKSGAETDPRKRWNGIDDYLRVVVEDEIGEMEEATLRDVPESIAKHYACRDADATLRIYPILRDKVQSMELNGVSRMDHDIIPMVDRMQEVGIGTDIPSFERLQQKAEAIMEEKRQAIEALSGYRVNPDSGDQVADLLFAPPPHGRGLEPTKTTAKKGRGSTDEKSLQALYAQDEVVDLILDYREASKIRNSFCRPIIRRASRDESGRIHCNIRVTRVSSGRLAATNPNLLAIPVRTELGREVRRGFVAGEGRILGDWDLDQIEMRVMAHESRDPLLMEIFNATDRDVHRETAARMFSKVSALVRTEERYAAKRVGFGVITGITEYGLVDQMALARALRPDGGAWTADDCRIMIQEYMKMYGKVKDYMEECYREAMQYGYVRDKWGRIRYLPGIRSQNRHIRQEAGRQAHSHKIQAGAQGIMKRAMRALWMEIRKPTWKTEPILQVHDELLLETDDNPGQRICLDVLAIQCLTKTSELSVPIRAKGSFGHNWAEAH